MGLFKILSGIAAVQVVWSALPSASYHLIFEWEQLVLNEILDIGIVGAKEVVHRKEMVISVIFKT